MRVFLRRGKFAQFKGRSLAKNSSGQKYGKWNNFFEI